MMSRRTRRPIASAGLAVATVFVCCVALRAALPAHTGYVTDLASVLDSSTEAALAARLRDIEQQTTAEVAVATVTSLDNMSVDEYANRLFRQWGIGKKGFDNGVLVLVAPSERKIRIEVGYGLEPILPDGLAGEIIRTEALPSFRSGNFPRGITATVERIATVIVANHTLTPEERAQFAETSSGPSAFASTVFFGTFIFLGFLSLGAGLRTKAIFMTLWGGLFGGIPFLMALIPFFNASLIVLVPMALAVFTFGWVKGGTERWRDIARGSKKSRRGKGGRSGSSGSSSRDSDDWVMGASSSSGGSSSSSSSGSFGGGRSGGGGASGSW